MARLNFKKAGLLSPKTLREEIVQGIDQMEQMEGQGIASAASEFPAVDLDAPEENYFTIGGAVSPMQHVDRSAESPISTLGDIDEKDITTDAYKEKLAPEKETDSKLNSERQVLSLYRWGANQLRAALFLTREQVAWQGDEVNDGLVGPNGKTPHPDLPSDNVIDPDDPFDDWGSAKPYEEFAWASYLLSEADQTYFDASIDTTPRVYHSPSVWHDLKMNEDLKDRFSGVEVRGLTGGQVESLLEEELPEFRQVRVKLPRTDHDGNFLDEDGNIVNDVDDAAMDNVLEPYDPDTGEQHRNIVIGRPGANSAFIPWFGDNMGEFNDPDAPSEEGGIAVDETMGFQSQTWMGKDPRVTWLKVVQDIGFHILLPEHWIVMRDV